MTDAPLSTPILDIPAPTLPDECCARCRFFMAGPTPNLPVFCRRFPPTPFITAVNWNEEKTAIVSNQQISTQAVVNVAGWCGEFVRKPLDVQ